MILCKYTVMTQIWRLDWNKGGKQHARLKMSNKVKLSKLLEKMIWGQLWLPDDAAVTTSSSVPEKLSLSMGSRSLA